MEPVASWKKSDLGGIRIATPQCLNMIKTIYQTDASFQRDPISALTNFSRELIIYNVLRASLIRRPPKICYYKVTESFRRAVRSLSPSARISYAIRKLVYAKIKLER